MHILNNGGQKIFISFLLCVWLVQICSPRLDVFFNRKVFSFNLTLFFYKRSIKIITFFIFILYSYSVPNIEFSCNFLIIMELGTRWICEIIMLSTVSYRLSQHGGVANAYVLRDPSSHPPAHSRILCPSTGSTKIISFTSSLIALCVRSRDNGIFICLLLSAPGCTRCTILISVLFIFLFVQ